MLSSSSCVVLRLTLFLRCAFRLSFAPFVYRSLLVCVSFLIFFSRYRSFPAISFSYLLSSPLSHIFPPLSHISFPHPYLISSLISPSLSRIPYLLPLPYPMSPRYPISPPSPLSHISFPLPYPHISFPISFPLLPNLLSPSSQSPFSFSLLPNLLSSHSLTLFLSFPPVSPYSKPSGRLCSPARWDFPAPVV